MEGFEKKIQEEKVVLAAKKHMLICVFCRNELLFSKLAKMAESWQKRYEEVFGSVEANKRNPSKYVAEEKLMVHFLKLIPLR